MVRLQLIIVFTKYFKAKAWYTNVVKLTNMRRRRKRSVAARENHNACRRYAT